MKKKSIYEIGAFYESAGYRLMGALMQRLLRGFYIFKIHKGEMVAGATTFFTILSFCPILLLLISAVGLLAGDVVTAKDIVLDTLKENIPQIAPWILHSIEQIVTGQLEGKSSITWLNVCILIYATLGFTGSLMFGIHTISKKESKGGFIIETGKSFINALLVWGYLILALSLSPNSPVLSKLLSLFPAAKAWLPYLTQYNLLTAFMTLGFFTMFYKWVSPLNIKVKDSFLGALSFLTLFMLGKSFYWIYLHYFKAELVQTFGSFYTLTVAVTWVYFMMCAFFLAASIAYCPYLASFKERRKPLQEKILGSIVDKLDVTPPKVPGSDKKAS